MTPARYRLLTDPAALGSARIGPAEDLRLGRMVELAVVPVTDPSAVATRLARLVGLRHPALAPIVDAEILDADRSAVELRLVWPVGTAPSLAGGLGAADALRVLEPLADALDDAHGAGITHGALEPAVVEVSPSRWAPPRLRRLGVLALADVAPSIADDRAAFARLARTALVGDDRRRGRIERLGPVVETNAATRLPDAAEHLLAAARPLACRALVRALRAHL